MRLTKQELRPYHILGKTSLKKINTSYGVAFVESAASAALSPGSGIRFGLSDQGAVERSARVPSQGGQPQDRGAHGGEPLRGERWPTPEWACDPENNMVLETRKDGRIIDMVRVDKKKCYRFGRNTRLGSDICVSFCGIFPLFSCANCHSTYLFFPLCLF